MSGERPGSDSTFEGLFGPDKKITVAETCGLKDRTVAQMGA